MDAATDTDEKEKRMKRSTTSGPARMRSVICTLIALPLIILAASCTFHVPAPDRFTVPYLMRGHWMDGNGTATVDATADNIILDYPYVPGASMNLDQLLAGVEGMYEVETTNTTLTVHSDSMGITMYRFIVAGDIMTIDMNLSERLILTRQTPIGG